MPRFTQTNASATAPSRERRIAPARGGVFPHPANEPREMRGAPGGVPRNRTVPCTEPLPAWPGMPVRCTGGGVRSLQALHAAQRRARASKRRMPRMVSSYRHGVARTGRSAAGRRGDVRRPRAHRAGLRARHSLPPHAAAGRVRAPAGVLARWAGPGARGARGGERGGARRAARVAARLPRPRAGAGAGAGRRAGGAGAAAAAVGASLGRPGAARRAATGRRGAGPAVRARAGGARGNGERSGRRRAERGWAPLRRAEPSEPPPPAAPPVPVAGSSLLRPAAPPAPEQDALTAACEKFLRDTDALARDLGAWLLERHTGARAAPGGAERHDLLNFFHAPRFAGAFPRGELLRTVRRWAAMPGLDLSAGGTISLEEEEEERPLQPAGSRAVAVDPPHEVRVVLRPAEGPRALAGLLGAIGRAQLRAGPPPDAPPEDLWLGDAGLTPACGALLEGLLLDGAWLRRCARADLPRDDERALGLAALLDARLDAARALASLEALRDGLGAGAEQACRELHVRAALSEIPAALASRELDPWLGPWADLRGRALAAHLRDFLRERFDEDFWRNPRALPALQGLWSRGGRPTLAELWAETGGEPSLDALTAELSRACG